MNGERIKEIKNKIVELRQEISTLSDEESELRKLDFLEKTGLKVGDKVIIDCNHTNSKEGIFVGCKKNGRPVVMKITKSGKAHKSATVWVWDDDDIKKA